MESMKHLVIGRYQMKVPKSFFLIDWSVFLRGVSVKPVKVQATPELVVDPKESLEALVATQREEILHRGEPGAWTLKRTDLQPGVVHLEAEHASKRVKETELIALMVHPDDPSQVYKFQKIVLETTDRPNVAFNERQRVSFWQAVKAFQFVRATAMAAAPLNSEWLYVPGGFIKLPHPADSYNSAELEDNLSLSFADEGSSITLTMEVDYPRKKDDEGLVSGLVPSVLQSLGPGKVLRSGARWLDGAKGEEALMADQGKILFTIKATPSKYHKDYRPAVTIDLEGKEADMARATAAWDAVIDTVFALVRSPPHE